MRQSPPNLPLTRPSIAKPSATALSVTVDTHVRALSYALLTGLMAVLLSLAFVAPVMAETKPTTADPAVYAGNDLYKKKCYVCHDVRKERINRAGPSLYGVVGRKAGSMAGFIYTPAMNIAAEDGMVWDEKTLDAFLANPQAVVPGTAMVKESALPKKEDRAAMIAYLKALKGK